MRKYVVLLIFTGLLSTISLPGMNAFAGGDDTAVFNPIIVNFDGCESIDGQVECSWTATGTGTAGVNSASHITFGIESCLQWIDSWEPTKDDPRIASVEFGPDPTTNVTGVKWNIDKTFDFKETDQEITFTVVLNISMEEIDLIMIGVKEGNSPNVQQILGPICPIITAGELIPYNNTALFLAGVQSMTVWMVPVVAGLAGVGVYLAKFRNRSD